jgi:SNF2 family DNA or RNA helicase
MNVLMQLRKVCNHPDLFDSRDYVTPCIQNFPIFFFVPSIILNLFTYNPLKDVNLKGLSLILHESEKLSKFDYLTMIKYFPAYSFFKVIKEIIESKK